MSSVIRNLYAKEKSYTKQALMLEAKSWSCGLWRRVVRLTGRLSKLHRGCRWSWGRSGAASHRSRNSSPGGQPGARATWMRSDLRVPRILQVGCIDAGSKKPRVQMVKQKIGFACRWSWCLSLSGDHWTISCRRRHLGISRRPHS